VPTKVISSGQPLTGKQFDALLLFLVRRRSRCDHTFRETVTWLKSQSAEVRMIIEKLVDLQAMCDCDVLEYVTAERWNRECSHLVEGPRIHGLVKWDQFIEQVLTEAGA